MFKTIENARALLAAATSGPWASGRADKGWHRHGCPALSGADTCHNVWSEDDRCDVTMPCAGLSKADAELIAAAPSLIAALCDEVEAAENRNEAQAELIDAWHIKCARVEAERDALRSRGARVCVGCLGRGLAHPDVGSVVCAACHGDGAVIVEGCE